MTNTSAQLNSGNTGFTANGSVTINQHIVSGVAPVFQPIRYTGGYVIV